MKRKTFVSVMVTALVMATGAFAYFLVTSLGEGEGSSKLGKGTQATYPISVKFAEGLSPGASEPISINLENTTGKATDIRSLKLTISDAAPGCEASWFSVMSHNVEWNEIINGTRAAAVAPIPIPAGNTMFNAAVADVNIVFKEESGVNQSACEGSTLTIKAVATS
jgi:hypothetical protein